MTIHELLDLKDLDLVEPQYSDLIFQDMDSSLVQAPAISGRILVDEDEVPSLFACELEDQRWVGCSTLYREPSLPLIEFFETIDWEMYQEPRSRIEQAVRGYYSSILVNSVTPSADDLNPKRADSIRRLIRELEPEPGTVCLDCCCGTGVGSLIMRESELIPVAYDNDDSLLVRGMIEKRLIPEQTMWIDGRYISAFLSQPVSLACGFMFGEIHSFNADLWKDLTTGICSISEKIIITAGTEPEIIQIHSWAESAGKKTEVFENEEDPIYDRWVCISK